jgi:hypothetical protein
MGSMPRPKSREGNSEQLCIKVSIALLEEIDAARGEQSRPDWGRDAFHAALGRKPAPLAADAVDVSRLGASEPPSERPRKPGKGPCDHRVNPGAWCKRCERLI